MDGSNFDPNMLDNFDFAEFMAPTEDEHNVLRAIAEDPNFDQAGLGSFGDFTLPDQYQQGFAAPPATPNFGDLSAIPGPCVWCDVPHGAEHKSDCPTLPLDDMMIDDISGQAQTSTAAYPTPTPQPTMPAMSFQAPAYPMPTHTAAYVPPPVYPLPTQTPARKVKKAASPSPDDEEVAPDYQHRFSDFDSARESLKNVDPLIQLNILNDDWAYIKSNNIHHYASQLFDALHAEPSAPPDNFTDDQTAYYYEHQATHLSDIRNKMHHAPERAEARVMMLLEEVLNVHEHGVPKSVCDRTDCKSGYLLENDFACSGRLEAVINAVSEDKYVATDVLSGTNIDDLARSPVRYLRRKRENCRVNARKANDKKLAAAEKVKRGEVKTPAAPPGMRKGRGVKSPGTPTPAAAMSPMQGVKRKGESDGEDGMKRMRSEGTDGE